MTRILRGDAASSLAFPLPQSAETASRSAQPDDEKLRLSARIAELERELAQQERRRVADIRQASLDGEAAGRKEAEARAEKLSDALSQAHSSFEERMGDLDQLAAAMVRRALAKIFDDADQRSEQVISVIRNWLGEQSALARVTIRISAADFADIGEEGLRDALGEFAEHVTADRSLASGSCMIDAHVGSINLAPLSQWRELEKAFQAMLGERAQ
ncbi:hypothetical protein AQZ52_17510 [Novosphingobium fuchskuhlense]|uniref:Flagellar assembly protein FliH n=1 Tax=Novosphingobium fuchskuhlense TaxID=1117702 RepID=A0A117US94_9SPHN|nr:FliH/SctL family protein [Novosphingobium fuchskuhlense]KUR69899.1 hypothetical protein AQZ52_17510 [Novosphingobium fuchskuhlense]